MTQSKLLRLIAYVAAGSLLLPLLIGGSNTNTAGKLSRYLQITGLNAKAVGTVAASGSDSTEEVVPESDLPGQTVAPRANQPAPPNQPTQPTQPAAPSTSSTTTTTPQATVTPKASTTGDKPASSYTVKAGDTYGCIAEAYYGSFEQYPEVMAANWASTAPGYGEYHLDVGAQVTLPAVSAANRKPATHLCQ